MDLPIADAPHDGETLIRWSEPLVSGPTEFRPCRRLHFYPSRIQARSPVFHGFRWFVETMLLFSRVRELGNVGLRTPS
jgi:hypothetical protein